MTRYYDVRLGAGYLRMLEEELPGILAAIASLPTDRMEDIVWHRSNCEMSRIEHDDDGWTLVAETVASVAGREDPLRCRIGPGAQARATNGHCPIDYLCESCQWELMTPAEREAEDRRWAEKSREVKERRGSRIADPTPSPANDQLPEWERELLVESAE